MEPEEIERKKFLRDLHEAHAVYEDLMIYEIRECIGKTTDIQQPLCMHHSIVAREMAQKGVIVCRICNKPLPEGEGRFNDHKILRHPECVQPICTKCATENPDAFYLAFKRGVDIRAVAPLSTHTAQLMNEIEQDRRGCSWK
jgi:hypothetical protein